MNRYQSLPGFTPSYDATGNLLNDSFHQYTWDQNFGNVLSIDTVGLTYDALGRMVEQNRSGSYTQIVYSPTGGKLALMNGQTLQKAFVALPTGATAVYTASGLAYYRHADWLGSSRLATTPTRTKYYDVAYAPYGENYSGSGTTDLSFTGQNQDTVTGLHDFMFREYHPASGRWISPDPAGLAAAEMTNPQSWNRYAYVGNNPLASVDPLGLEICEVSTGGGGSGCESGGGYGPWIATPGGGGGFEYGGDTPGRGLNMGEGSASALDRCGVDPFCIEKGGVSALESPVAQVHCDDDGGCMVGSYVYSRYVVGGGYDIDWAAQKQAEIRSASNILVTQAAKIAQALGVGLDRLLAAQNLDSANGPQPFLQGGNWNFLVPSTAQTPVDCDNGRCSDFPSLHFAHPGYVHLDTANPETWFGVGALVHLSVDVILGNTIFASGIPR